MTVGSRGFFLAAFVFLAGCAASTGPDVYLPEPPDEPPLRSYPDLLADLLDAFIDRPAPGPDPSPSPLVRDIQITSACYALALETHENLTPAQSMERLDRLFFEHIGSLDRHQAFVAQLGAYPMDVWPLYSEDQIRSLCATDYRAEEWQ